MALKLISDNPGKSLVPLPGCHTVMLKFFCITSYVLLYGGKYVKIVVYKYFQLVLTPTGLIIYAFSLSLGFPEPH